MFLRLQRGRLFTPFSSCPSSAPETHLLPSVDSAPAPEELTRELTVFRDLRGEGGGSGRWAAGSPGGRSERQAMLQPEGRSAPCPLQVTRRDGPAVGLFPEGWVARRPWRPAVAAWIQRNKKELLPTPVPGKVDGEARVMIETAFSPKRACHQEGEAAPPPSPVHS